MNFFPSEKIESLNMHTGFTGSAGTAVITNKDAALFTDGRYFLQAERQLDKNWTLMKQGLAKVPSWQEWVGEKAKGGKNVGVDPTLITQGNSATIFHFSKTTLTKFKSRQNHCVKV